MTTDLENLTKELQEVINLFELDDNIDITHCFAIKDGNYINTVTIDGEAFSYADKIPKTNSEMEEKRYIKRYAKLSVYKAISEKTKQIMPWGALTGVRPTKLAYQELRRGCDFISLFRDELMVSKEKTDLTAKVIDAQSKIFDYNNVFAENRADLYVSLPFCPTRCEYCSFISSDINHTRKYLPDYIDALCKEIESSITLSDNIKSIYIGGGTPVCIDNKYLEKVLKTVKKGNIECTVEAGRPDVITKDNLKLLEDYGVTRICINPQTFNQKTLDLMQRKHTVEQIYEKYNLAKGKFIINMDLIAGLTGESFNDFRFSIDKAIELNPENITVHTLCLKNGSAMKQSVERLSPGEINDMVTYAYRKLNENGYFPYYIYRQKYMAGNLENAGYCKNGTECVYNVDIMEEVSSIIACGANAISKKISSAGAEGKLIRYANSKDIPTYIGKVDEIIENKRLLFNNNI